MKKIVLLFAMVLMSISGFAQADKIINSYKDNSGIQIIELNKAMLEMVAGAAKSDEEKEALKSVDSMTMGMIGSDELAKEIFEYTGNILGEEQSGQINAVGFHLYCELLRDCVAMFKRS